MTNSCRRPAMRWNEVTGAIARHKRASTQCGRLNTFASVSPWTCSGISRRPIAHRPRRPCIRPVLGRKNSKNDATVSEKVSIWRLNMRSDDDKPLTPEQARQKLQKGLSDYLAGNDPGTIVFRLNRSKKASETCPLKLTQQQRETLLNYTQLSRTL